MTTWTLALDESGRFERTAEAHEVLVVGGVLVPEALADLRNRWKDKLKRECERLGLPFPPHATDMRKRDDQRPKLAKLNGLASRAVAESDGAWVFLVSRSTGRAGPDMALHVRMLGALVALAARIVASTSGDRIDLCIAQRTMEMAENAVRDARRAGVVLQEVEVAGERLFRSVMDGEARQALDALGREPSGRLPPFPTLGEMSIASANSHGAHPALHFADLGCNETRSRIWKDGRLDVETLCEALVAESKRVLVVSRRSLEPLRRLDRAWRSSPADPATAGEALASAEAHARGSREVGEDFGFAFQSAAAWGEAYWQRVTESLAARLVRDANEPERMARVLAQHADARLKLKSGSYEGIWKALQTCWAGDGPLARRLRDGTRDRELRGQLWRITLECANHRGDTRTAVNAAEAFESVLREGVSLQLLAEALHVRNLATVTQQNRLPCDSDQVEVRMGELRAASDRLVEIAEEAAELVTIAERIAGPAGSEVIETTAGPHESDLWKSLCGGAPSWERPDIEVGRCLGTAARSLAFEGRLQEALATAMRARARFGSSPFDLRFNGAVLAGILLEAARLGDPSYSPDRLRAALSAAEVGPVKKPRQAVEAIKDFGPRFQLDLVLKTLLWTQDPAAFGCSVDAWVKALSNGGNASILQLMAKQMRSHPTELVARHAAELLEIAGGHDEMVRSWLDLSIAISEEGDTTMRQLAVFSRRLRDETAAPDAPPGSVDNPSFEYR